MRKYKYYLLSVIGIIIMFYGALNASTTVGIALWGIGIIISFIGVLLQITFAPNFKC